MKRIILVVLLLIGVVGILSADTLKEINERYSKQVDAEVKRKHELELEEKRIEVLARLNQLDNSTVNVYSTAHAGIINKNKSVSNSNNKGE